MNLVESSQERVKGLLPDLMRIKFTHVTPDKVVALVTQTQLVIAA